MKQITTVLLLIVNMHFIAAQETLPVYDPAKESKPVADWLVTPVKEPAAVYQSNNGKDLVLYNGLVKRVFRLAPNIACIDYSNTSNGQQLLRAVKAEAAVRIDGKEYNVGGLYGQRENAYLLPEWVDGFKDSSNDFHFIRYVVSKIQPRLVWKPAAASFHAPLPAAGTDLSFVYQSSLPVLKGLVIIIHYELYEGLPLIVKWLSIENKGAQTFKLNRVINERLAFTEEESAVVGSPEQMKKQHGI
jgi:hypothetical protein